MRHVSHGNPLRVLPSGFEALYRLQKLMLDGPWSDVTATLDQALRRINHPAQTERVGPYWRMKRPLTVDCPAPVTR